MRQLTAIGFASAAQMVQAQSLARSLGLIVDNQVLPRLCVMEDKLVLLLEHFAPLFVDFERATQETRPVQGLIRACKPKPGMTILDVTAGWGKDAALLASRGAKVVMLERQPIMTALLADGLERLSPYASLELSLIPIDAHCYLQTLPSEQFPDIIYMDPMHPARQKTALVKKNLQALQQIIDPDEDADALLALALTKTRQKVIVKWPERLPPLKKPCASLSGKTTRFDIYTCSPR